MRKRYLILAAALILIMGNTLTSLAQAPQAFTYQAEARDAMGKILSSKALTVKVTILKGSAKDGLDVWDRNYNVTTDKYGLFTIIIEDEEKETGFATIDWGAGTYYLNVQIKSGSIWLNTGTTQLLSVPYALYANSAGSTKTKETDPLWSASPSFGITSTNISNWNAAFGWGDHANAGYLTRFTEADPIFAASPSFGITSTNISNWSTAFGWGDHAGLYRTANWVPSWKDVAGKPFKLDNPLHGDLLMYDGGIGYWINWEPDFLRSYTETDPLYSANFDLTGAATGDLLKFNGSKFVKYAPDLSQTNYNYSGKYGVKLQPRNDAQIHVDLVLSPKGFGAILRQQPDGTKIGGNNRGERAIDLQILRSENTEVASGDLSMIIGNLSNTASGYMSSAVGNFNTASGRWATALGTMATASGIYTFATGYNSLASGEFSIAMGTSTTASGNGSFSAGFVTTAAGYYSTAMGVYTTAPSGYEITTGRFNTLYTPASTTDWNSNDRLFVVGNGTAEASRSNALTILKNANTTIGGSLTINGNGTHTSYAFPTGRGTSGQVLTTQADGTTSWAPAGLVVETDPLWKDSPSSGITSTKISNWDAAFGWGNHADLYLPVNWIPSWNEVTDKPFFFRLPQKGDLLIYDDDIERFKNWTPDYLTTETDPIVKAITGLVKSNGTTISAAASGIDYLAPGQAVTAVTATAPIVSTGGITPVISVNPATTSAAGSMSATDKNKLDGIAAGAEVNVNADWNATEGDAKILNKPDLTVYATKDMNSANITNLADPVNAQDAATKAYVDALKAEVNALKLKVAILAGTPYSELLASGATVIDLLAAGATISGLLEAGKTIRSLLDEGVTPSRFIGTFYAGGVIFSLDATGSGMVCTVSDQSAAATWATAVGLCSNLETNGYNDWFLPDDNQLQTMCYNKAIINHTAKAHEGQDFGAIYWTSHDVNLSHPGQNVVVYIFDPCYPTVRETNIAYAVRAIRSFTF